MICIYYIDKNLFSIRDLEILSISYVDKLSRCNINKNNPPLPNIYKTFCPYLMQTNFQYVIQTKNVFPYVVKTFCLHVAWKKHLCLYQEEKNFIYLIQIGFLSTLFIDKMCMYDIDKIKIYTHHDFNLLHCLFF